MKIHFSKDGLKKISSVSITLIIVLMLIFSGPASAVTVSISGLSAEYTKGSEVNFLVSVTIEDTDKYVPISNFTLNLTGSMAEEWIFATDGAILSGDTSIISIVPISQPGSSEFGYGYGVDNITGDGYNFGYGYGYDYGYNYGAGGGSLTYIYDVTLNTSDFNEGTYTVRAGLNTGNAVKPAFNSPEETFIISSAEVIRNITLTVDDLEKTTINFVNATYTLNLTNIGDAADSFALTVENKDGAAVAALEKYLISLDAGASSVIKLNVTGISGSYAVNVTATSQGNTSVFRTVSTTTEVTAAPYFAIGNLTVDEGAFGITSLYLNNADNVGSFDVNITFDSTVANLTAITKDSAVEHLVYRIDNATGLARIGGFNLNNSLIGDVKLADLTVKAKEDQGDSTPLDITVNSLADENATPIPQFGIQEGVFRIRDKTANITVNASPETILADGKDKSKITALLTDKFGNKVANGTTVNFTSNRSIDAFLDSGTNRTSNTTIDGITTVYLKGSAAGVYNISAENNSIFGYVNVKCDYKITETNTNVTVTGNVSEEVLRVQDDAVIEVNTTVDLTLNITATITANASLVNVSSATEQYGIATGEVSIERYLNITADIAPENLSSVNITMFYTDADLDLNKNGVIGDVGDIDESKLKMYWWSGTRWLPLDPKGINYSDPSNPSYTPGGPEVKDIFRNIDNNKLTVKLNHFSTFAIVGEIITEDEDEENGGGGGSSGTRIVTPTPTATAIETTTAKATATPAPTEVVEVVPTPTPTPAPKKWWLPGFSILAALSGLLALAYILGRRKE